MPLTIATAIEHHAREARALRARSPPPARTDPRPTIDRRPRDGWRRPSRSDVRTVRVDVPMIWSRRVPTLTTRSASRTAPRCDRDTPARARGQVLELARVLRAAAATLEPLVHGLRALEQRQCRPGTPCARSPSHAIAGADRQMRSSVSSTSSLVTARPVRPFTRAA